jgi:hypothetical protein
MITSEAARRLDNDRPHTVALDPLQHRGEAGAHIDGIGNRETPAALGKREPRQGGAESP